MGNCNASKQLVRQGRPHHYSVVTGLLCRVELSSTAGCDVFARRINAADRRAPYDLPTDLHTALNGNSEVQFRLERVTNCITMVQWEAVSTVCSSL